MDRQALIQPIQIQESNRRPNALKVTLLLLILTLTSCSLPQVGWLRLSGTSPDRHCPTHLAPYQFFDIGSFTSTVDPLSGRVTYVYHCHVGHLNCLNPTFVLLMRCLLASIFLGILVTFVDFLISLIRPENEIANYIDTSYFCNLILLLFLVGTVIISNLAAVTLTSEQAPDKANVNYEYGFWTLVSALITAILTFVIRMFQTSGCCSCSDDDLDQVTSPGFDEEPPPSYADLMNNLGPNPPPPAYSPNE